MNAMAPRIPLARPRLPSAEQLLPYLRIIDGNRVYANLGPLYRELLVALERTCGLPPQGSLVVSSATAALASVLSVGARRGRSLCLLPSWTFVATAAAVARAGFTPWFCDVDAESWALDPARLARHPRLHEAAAVIPVAPFGRSIPYEDWARFAEETGVPVFIDAAAAFDSVSRELRRLRAHPPVIVSLHATKPVSTGEGGWVIAQDQRLLHAVLKDSNFGYDTDRQIGTTLGANFKLSEYNAALGLAALEHWDTTRQLLAARQAHYARRLAAIGIGSGPQPGDVVSTTYNVLLPASAEPIRAALAREGIESRAWWGAGVHALPAYAAFPRDALPVTDMLASRVLGLPFFVDMAFADIDDTVACLGRAMMPSDLPVLPWDGVGSPAFAPAAFAGHGLRAAPGID